MSSAEVLSQAKGTRVLRAHVAAVLDAWDSAAAAALLGGREAAAEVIAEAVVTATDGMSRWVLIDAEGLIYGPYATAAAARRSAVYIGTRDRPSTAQLSVLIPAPKRGKVKR